jgi:DNA-binding MarR family transcriptional regulator
MSTVENDTGIEQDIYRMLTKTFILLDDCDRRFFAEYGLSMRQFWALQHLDEQHGCSMVDLSRVLFTDKSNVTGIVDRLEQLNLVTRTPDPRDRRVILITLTSEGQQLRDTVSMHHTDLIRHLIHVMHSANLHSLLDSLHAISHNIEAYLTLMNDA